MKIDIRRKREAKTDYYVRMRLLKSGLPRIVIRKTNRYINIQYVKSREAKDRSLLSVSSKNLIKFGWPKNFEGKLKSIPASYLTGYLAGKEIIKKGYKEDSILDIGLARNVLGSRLYAALNGLVDAGVKIKYNDKAFPKKERIEGKHMDKNVQVILNKIKETIK